eukprot:2172721-Amphidinium_carterae.1
MDRARRRTGKLNAALGGVWREERAHSAFQVGATCVRRGEGVENLEHIVHHCPHWNKEGRESCLPSHAQEAPACVRLHGLLPAPPPGALLAHEPALVMKVGVHWRDRRIGQTQQQPTLQKMWSWLRH